MHELSITRNIVAIVNEHAEGKEVKRVVLAIGKSTAIVPDAIRFCFDVCNKGTLCENAQLEIREVSDKAVCKTCGLTFELPLTNRQCSCGYRQLERIAGDELLVKEIELY